MTKKTPIAQRIKTALQSTDSGRMSYQALAYAVFPPKEYPRSWRHASGGGPPGCYMALSAALRRLRVWRDFNKNPEMVGPWPAGSNQ